MRDTTTRNPHGQLKSIYMLNPRSLETFEKEYLNDVLVNPEREFKVFTDTQRSNWNMILVDNQYFVSMPKTPKDCKPSIFGSIKHALKYCIFYHQEKEYNFN